MIDAREDMAGDDCDMPFQVFSFVHLPLLEVELLVIDLQAHSVIRKRQLNAQQVSWDKLE